MCHVERTFRSAASGDSSWLRRGLSRGGIALVRPATGHIPAKLW
jgi:hypothetical protein